MLITIASGDGSTDKFGSIGVWIWFTLTVQETHIPMPAWFCGVNETPKIVGEDWIQVTPVHRARIER